ncbi:protein containing lamin tail domain [Longilinea arvoryzae]|uniref:Protein containing lamin tail domain n=1 Tax=Longilinea arvoryzae TaxID=360412 RepID=A0A0S7BNP7_9CHLR|nr:lamin tail domain-containing protein [Longilinea arvoryzae]GAP15461.1 protein containing lamin tail domain [Longilinea arvoryzae]
MASWKRTLPFLLINVLVSAVTTILVLTIWDHAHSSALPAAQTSTNVAAATQTTPASVAQAPAGDGKITIENVFGVGDYQTEVVEITRDADTDLVLTGWKLRDENGHEYTFPNLTLKKGAIRVYTRSGTDSVIELFWGQKQAVWEAGELVALVDAQGTLQASYRIP